ncbi:serine/threonine-protein kinase [Haliangium ochraceum]|uniref:Serine/threonine protein kinase n=1 Tax=Haliangium ochraceum (strain DSM 14365 / JCM 11303 / SMP-2) TaxID=502025 RepID=D0LJI3_HALO1|nr:serine/threonine-protein kinase [Haliangium ochraceum]ACY16557.1 serine/threonine protein kinase [Haliangium ochraceum DSM 14365]
MFRKGFARCPLDGAPLSPLSADPLEGTVFADRYVIEECVGEGGMGRVYRASHRHMSRQFAVKVLFGEHAAEQEMQARFAREAEAACRLSHPNVVTVIDFGETEQGLFYLVMDWVEGRRLTDLITHEAPMPRERVADITRQILEGLTHAHEQGLVHRDLKSENLIVSVESERELVRIVDFGLAVGVESESDARLTAEGTVYGTPAYMSPEQACGMALDGRTDLFSLGVLVYEMLCGELPFTGVPMDIVRQNMNDEPPWIDARVPGLSVDRSLESLARKLMAKRPQDRYQSAREVLAVLAELNGAWTRPGSMRERARHDTVVAGGPSRRRWPVIAGVAGVLVLLSGLGFVLSSMSPAGEGEAVVARAADGAGGEPAAAMSIAEAAAAEAAAAEAAKAAAAAEAAEALAAANAGEPAATAADAASAEAASADAASADADADANDDEAREEARRRRRARRERGRAEGEAEGEAESGREAPAERSGHTAAEVSKLYTQVGALVDKLAKTRDDAAAKALVAEYFAIPAGSAQLNAALREDVWRRLTRLRAKVRSALAR